MPPTKLTKITTRSGSKIRPLPIQRRPHRPRPRRQNHPGQACPNHHGARGPGLGRRERDGAQGKHRERDGRADGVRGDGYIGAEYSEFENGMKFLYIRFVEIVMGVM